MKNGVGGMAIRGFLGVQSAGWKKFWLGPAPPPRAVGGGAFSRHNSQLGCGFPTGFVENENRCQSGEFGLEREKKLPTLIF